MYSNLAFGFCRNLLFSSYFLYAYALLPYLFRILSLFCRDKLIYLAKNLQILEPPKQQG